MITRVKKEVKSSKVFKFIKSISKLVPEWLFFPRSAILEHLNNLYVALVHVFTYRFSLKDYALSFVCFWRCNSEHGSKIVWRFWRWLAIVELPSRACEWSCHWVRIRANSCKLWLKSWYIWISQLSIFYIVTISVNIVQSNTTGTRMPSSAHSKIYSPIPRMERDVKWVGAFSCGRLNFHAQFGHQTKP